MACVEEEESKTIDDENDIFKPSYDANGKIIISLIQDAESNFNGLTDDQQVQLFVTQTKELFDREKGKSISKKLNLGDVISTKI